MHFIFYFFKFPKFSIINLLFLEEVPTYLSKADYTNLKCIWGLTCLFNFQREATTTYVVLSFLNMKVAFFKFYFLIDQLCLLQLSLDFSPFAHLHPAHPLPYHCPIPGSYTSILWLIPSPSFIQSPAVCFPLAAISLFSVSMLLFLFCSLVYCVH